LGTNRAKLPKFALNETQTKLSPYLAKLGNEFCNLAVMMKWNLQNYNPFPYRSWPKPGLSRMGALHFWQD
jgi:hypothetical protein